MSTTTAVIDTAAPSRIPFRRLIAVEARKSVDTRASMAVLGTFLAVGLLILAFTALMDSAATLTSAMLPATLVLPALPVIGVLAMTSEWSQRTASTTFRLEPRRTRVLFAKLSAALLVSTALIAAVVLSCVAVMAAVLSLRGLPLDVADLGSWVRLVVASAVLLSLYGVAWGALVTVTPAAILFAVLSSLLGDLVVSFVARGLAPWFSSSTAVNWLAGTPGEPAPEFTGGVVTGFLLWYVAPLGIGIWLQTRREAR